MTVADNPDGQPDPQAAELADTIRRMLAEELAALRPPHGCCCYTHTHAWWHNTTMTAVQPVTSAYSVTMTGSPQPFEVTYGS